MVRYTASFGPARAPQVEAALRFYAITWLVYYWPGESVEAGLKVAVWRGTVLDRWLMARAER